MMLKNLTNNAKNLAASAKIEDMTQLFKGSVGKQDVKHALSGVMDISKEVSHRAKISFCSESSLTRHLTSLPYHLKILTDKQNAKNIIQF